VVPSMAWRWRVSWRVGGRDSADSAPGELLGETRTTPSRLCKSGITEQCMRMETMHMLYLYHARMDRAKEHGYTEEPRRPEAVAQGDVRESEDNPHHQFASISRERGSVSISYSTSTLAPPSTVS
jgi:hypothetical protein